MFYLILPSVECRQSLISHLKRQGILAVFHYVPLHLSPMGANFRWQNCPVSEDVSTRLLRLPFYNDLSEGELEQIVVCIKQFFTHRLSAASSNL
jgi:dTDP-4-amino-4,6-dideoxygalactose transaminase